MCRLRFGYRLMRIKPAHFAPTELERFALSYYKHSIPTGFYEMKEVQ